MSLFRSWYKMNPKYAFYALSSKDFFKWMPTEIYLKMKYYCKFNKKLDLDNPKSLNEKIQWLKINDIRPEYTLYADKFSVREYIKNKIGGKYLIPILYIHEQAQDIDYDVLPDRFVLKCTHGSGANIICTDKSKLNFHLVDNKLKYWMKRNYYWHGREYQYKNIVPRIICEEFLSSTDMVPSDYKIMCFNGNPRLIQLHSDRFGNYTMDYYTPQWKKTDISRMTVSTLKEELPKPKHLDEMLEIATLLSHGIPYCRIDLYEANERIYFGEITLHPASGFGPFRDYKRDLELGSWVNLMKT